MYIEVSTPIAAEAEIKQYTLVGDDIYIKRYTNANIPTWYRQLVSDIIAADATITDLDSAIAYLSTLPAGYNQMITELQNADLTINTSLTSLVATAGSHMAAIANLAITKVDATSAAAIARTTVGAYFADGSAGAFFNNQISTYASDISANAMNISTLSATLGGHTVRIDTVEAVNITQGGAISTLDTTVNTLATNVGVSLGNLQSQIDGNISTYFQSYAPTLLNVPASAWTTDLIKANHVGDLFYDRTTGYGYRFAYEDIVDTPDAGIIYSWIRITDVDVTAALANAANAQATADGKRTVFYTNTTPVPMVENGITIPIEIGDMWVNSDTKVTKVAIAVTPSVVWGDITNTSTENALLALTDLEEARDGNVVVYYEISTTIPVGMTYGDYLVDTDSLSGNSYTVYRYENATGGSSGTLSWYINTGETAKALSSGYRAQVLAGTAQSTADGKVTTWYQISAPVLTTNDIGDIWVDTDNGNKLQVWSGTVWTDPTSAQGTQAYTWSASASKLITSPDGSVTGWSFGDGTNIKSFFQIQATNFKISDGTTGYTPFSIVGSDILFNGKVSFTNITGAPTYAQTYYQISQPTGTITNGSVWYDSDDNNRAYRFNGSVWQEATTNISGLGYTKNTTFKQITAPTVMTVGDIWIDSDDNNKTYWFNGTIWTLVDPDVAVAINTNTTTIDGAKITTGSITASQIAANTITAGQIAAGTITASEIAASTITAGQIAASTITTTQIAANTVTAGNIAATSITGDRLAVNSAWISGIVQSSDFTTIGGAGFRLKAEAASTNADPDIYGAYIRGGTIDGTTINASTINIRNLNIVNDAGYNILPIFSCSPSLGPDTSFNDPMIWDFLTDMYTYNSTNASAKRTIGTTGTRISISEVDTTNIWAPPGYLAIIASTSAFTGFDVDIMVGFSSLASRTGFSVNTDYDIGGFIFRLHYDTAQVYDYTFCIKDTTSDISIDSTSSSPLHIRVNVNWSGSCTYRLRGFAMLVSNL